MTLHTHVDKVSLPPPNGYDNKKAMTVMTALFFMCGFLATLNDILIPHLKSIFELTYAKVMLIQFSFFSSFLIFGYPFGKMVEWIGYQKTLVFGLLMMSTGALLFLPAAAAPSFVLFMGALVILAGGVTALQVSGNPYISVLGSPRTAASRLNLTQAFNSLGSTIAPYVGGVLILRAAARSAVDAPPHVSGEALHAFRVQQASYVKGPYIGIAVTLFILACAVALQKLPRVREPGALQAIEGDVPSVWSYPQLVLGVGAMFLYCGAEITIGSFLVSYLTQPNIGAMTPKVASAYVSIYWGGSMIGRFVGSALLQKIRAGRLLGINATFAVSLVAASMIFYGHVAMWAILLVGTFNSIMFPSLFTLGIAGLGSLTGKGSGILMSAAVGAAVIPVIQGALADNIGVHHSFLVPAICYLYVAFYGFRGSRPKAEVSVLAPPIIGPIS
jgi:MFS transporter, FHS family, L-fucose permease